MPFRYDTTRDATLPSSRETRGFTIPREETPYLTLSFRLRLLSQLRQYFSNTSTNFRPCNLRHASRLRLGCFFRASDTTYSPAAASAGSHSVHTWPRGGRRAVRRSTSSEQKMASSCKPSFLLKNIAGMRPSHPTRSSCEGSVPRSLTSTPLV